MDASLLVRLYGAPRLSNLVQRWPAGESSYKTALIVIVEAGVLRIWAAEPEKRRLKNPSEIATVV